MSAILNNFSSFKKDFTSDTGLVYGNETIGLYIQYVNSRCNDMNTQYLEMIEEKLYSIEDEIKNVSGTLIENFDAVSNGIFEIRKVLAAKKEIV
jgi:hypothetical protein